MKYDGLLIQTSSTISLVETTETHIKDFMKQMHDEAVKIVTIEADGGKPRFYVKAHIVMYEPQTSEEIQAIKGNRPQGSKIMVPRATAG